MAKVSAFGFTNTTDSTHTVTPKLLGLTSNYAVTDQDANEATLSNKTAPIDTEEKITFRSRSIQNVNNDLNIQYPSPIKSGIQYQVMVEDTLSTTDSTDSSFRVDEPIVAQLTIRHPKSGNITGDLVAVIVTRLLSSLIKADGTWRFDDLMRQAERPVID
jgi:hypothetical protein